MHWADICKGFAFQKEHYFWEEKVLSFVAAKYRIPFKLFNSPKDVPNDFIPCGNVDWGLSVLGRNITPDYYPEFLSEYISRKIWKADNHPIGVFVKPADKFKRFSGIISALNSDERWFCDTIKPPFWCSEVVKFQDEWRCYVQGGKLLGCYWYAGVDDSPKDPPKEIFSISWPEDWYGAADFGILDNGKLELVECHPPFACGWYGKNHEEYASWITFGWKWLKKVV